MLKYMSEGYLIDTPENKSYIKNYASLYEAYQQDRILEARAVVCDSEHNLIVDLMGIKGIIPKNEGAIGIDTGETRDIAIISRVNKPVCFKIISIEKDENDEPHIVLSRKKVQEECRDNYIKNLKSGDIINAKVTHLEAFGAFVDIGAGISSLIPIDAISVSRITHPRDRFYAGEDIRAVVKSVDETGRVSLSHKELLGSWSENANKFKAGETVAGIVRSVEDYGIFIELAPNLAGLAEPKDNVFVGQQASVYIKSLIPDKMKVKLIVVDSFDAEYHLPALEYFNTADHIDYWRYSPIEANKIIETQF